MKKIFLGLVGIFLVSSLCGCAAVLVGGGVAGGVAISKDTAKLEIDANYDSVWDAAYKTIDDMGIISLRDQEAGKIEVTLMNSTAFRIR